MDGFDPILKFVCKKYRDNSVKWFRLWKSGFLEHGGIIDVEYPQGDDTDEYGESKGKLFTVKLDWKYDGNLVAPCYDFQSLSMEGFHFADGQIQVD